MSLFCYHIEGAASLRANEVSPHALGVASKHRCVSEPVLDRELETILILIPFKQQVLLP